MKLGKATKVNVSDDSTASPKVWSELFLQIISRLQHLFTTRPDFTLFKALT